MHNDEKQASKLELLGEAIRRRRNIDATYNGGVLRLSPHQVFVRNDAFYLGAFNAQKSRRHDEEPTLGEYNLAGLSKLAVTAQSFEPLQSFDRSGIRPGDEVIMAVESGPHD